MRQIIAMEYVTLDGVMEAPETWQFPYMSEDVADEIRGGIQAFDALLLGRVTYEIFAAHWPKQTNNEFGVADKLNSMAKHVVSATLDVVEWNHSTLIQADVTDSITRLKQQPGGNIAVIGSATLVESLAKAGLIDEYRLLIHPVIVGRGKRLFTDALDTTGLRLTECKTFSSGVVRLSYQPAA